MVQLKPSPALLCKSRHNFSSFILFLYVNPGTYGSSFPSVVFALDRLHLPLQFTPGLSPEDCLFQPT